MRIVTDSAADLAPDDLAAFDISVVPLYIQFPEGEVRSEDLTHDEFYNRLEAMRPQLPTTGQPSPGNFTDLYRSLKQDGESILSIHISSGLSGTVNAARIGATQATEDNIHVVDSLTLSGGLRFQVIAAARAINAGWELPNTLAQLDRIRTATEVVYTLDTLEYLARGGRIGRVQALASSVLNIKPIINVSKSDGKYNTVGKSRTISRAVNDLTEHLVSLFGTDEPLWVSVMHGRFEEKANQLAELIQGVLPVAKLEVLRISPVLGVHTGPGIVGAAVVPMRYLEEIQ
jgi:DegV family protein with EDD domain